jgi:hypothetical protein
VPLSLLSTARALSVGSRRMFVHRVAALARLHSSTTLTVVPWSARMAVRSMRGGKRMHSILKSKTSSNILGVSAAVVVGGGLVAYGVAQQYGISLSDILRPPQKREMPTSWEIPKPPDNDNVHPFEGKSLIFKVGFVVQRAAYLIAVFTPFAALSLYITLFQDDKLRKYVTIAPIPLMDVWRPTHASPEKQRKKAESREEEGEGDDKAMTKNAMGCARNPRPN